ncbi:DMT family transporter [Kiloniella sp. b19]|uniref:DMT family transporter n=1 Tax=Kiloniella sp. GXU_MW_B19 TaxID=3141326 RepID=UPI0031D0B3C2
MSNPALSEPENFWTSKLFGYLCGTLGMLIWSGWVVVSRYGVQQTLTPIDITLVRYLTAAALILPFLVNRWMKRGWWHGLSFFQALVITTGIGTPYAVMAYGGFAYAPAAHAGIFINGAVPVFVALLLFLWIRQKVSLNRLISILFLVAGCVLVGWSSFSGDSGQAVWFGDLLFLGAGLFFALYTVSVGLWGVRPAQAMTVVPSFSLVMILIIWLAGFGESHLRMTAVEDWPWEEVIFQAVYQGPIVTLLAMSCFVKTALILGPSKQATFTAMVPAGATVLALLVLGEVPSVETVIGLGVVTGGIVLSLRRSSDA